MAGGDGTDIAQEPTFGDCPGSDVVAYQGRGACGRLETHFNFKVRTLSIAWDFFQGRTRDDSSIRGVGSAGDGHL